MNRSIVIFSCLLSGAASGEAAEPAENAALQASLRGAFPWTSADGRTGEIIVPGVILTVRKDGITTSPVDAPLSAQNNYMDGIVKQSALNLFAQDQNTAEHLVTGDRVFVTKTEVKETSVVLHLLSVEPFHGLRVKATVAFHFPHGLLGNATFRQVAPIIEELFATSNPPPPAAPSQQAGRIEPGAGIQQVIARMGDPPIVADINRKLIFFYPDAKVIFLDGKVVDVK